MSNGKSAENKTGRGFESFLLYFLMIIINNLFSTTEPWRRPCFWIEKEFNTSLTLAVFCAERFFFFRGPTPFGAPYPRRMRLQLFYFFGERTSKASHNDDDGGYDSLTLLVLSKRTPTKDDSWIMKSMTHADECRRAKTSLWIFNAQNFNFPAELIKQRRQNNNRSAWIPSKCPCCVTGKQQGRSSP